MGSPPECAPFSFPYYCMHSKVLFHPFFPEPTMNRVGAGPLDGEVMVGGRGSRLSSSSSGSSHTHSTGGEGGASGVVGGAPTRREVGSGARSSSWEDVPVKIPKGETTPVKPAEKRYITTSTPILRPSYQVPDSSIISTPGGVTLPPNPPPTPVGGVGGVPVPPPPPPAIPGGQQGHLKRVNWEKLYGTEGTIWKEVT